jgi:hypothetical protein
MSATQRAPLSLLDLNVISVHPNGMDVPKVSMEDSDGSEFSYDQREHNTTATVAQVQAFLEKQRFCGEIAKFGRACGGALTLSPASRQDASPEPLADWNSWNLVPG